jgi:outer membrane biosynthesis protein TonB
VNHTVPLPLLVALLLVLAMLLQACTAGQPGTASPAATLSPTASGDPAESTPEATPASVSENAGGSDASVSPSKPTPKSANDPSTEPSPEPSGEATPEPAAEPTADPSDDPTPAPTSEPAVESTATPSTNQPADPDASPADPEADADGNDANNTDNGTATPPPNTTYLQKLPTPEGLAPGVRVAASDSADLDGNGTIENVYLLWDTNGDLLLQVTTGTMGSDPVTRRVLGPEGLADNLQGPVVSALLLERFSEYDTRDIAIGFSSLTYGDSQWMLYRHVPGEPLQLMIQEPYAVEHGNHRLPGRGRRRPVRAHAVPRPRGARVALRGIGQWIHRAADPQLFHGNLQLGVPRGYGPRLAVPAVQPH